MAVCRKFGSPDLFITFTCKPKSPEIKQHCDLIKNVTPADRPDIMARVFKIKLDILLEDLCHNHVLGNFIGGIYYYFICSLICFCYISNLVDI